jgi:outer membrane protein OmpA-like peptidoglycan-associated protein
MIARIAAASGYQLETYEPTPAGEAFLTVPMPTYDPTRLLAAALTLDYGNTLLRAQVLGSNGPYFQAIIAGQFLGHLDLSSSFWERLQLFLSLPIDLAESGTAGFGVAPNSGVVVGDPRVGATVRLWGDGMQEPFSLHLRGVLWIPVGTDDKHAGDASVRGGVYAVVAGTPTPALQYAANVGFIARSVTNLSTSLDMGALTGSALQVQGAAQYVHGDFSVGPELTFLAITSGARGLTKEGTTMEGLVSAHCQVARDWRIGGGVGFGIMRNVGIPSVRGVVRLTYEAPMSEPEPAPAPQPAPEPQPQPETQAQPAPAPESQPTPAPEPQPAPAPQEKPAPASEPTPPPAAPAPVMAPAKLPAGCADVEFKDAQRLAIVMFGLNMDVSAEGHEALVVIGTWLAQNPQARVDIIGHADTAGAPDYNLDLSERRAKHMAEVLRATGANDAQLRSRGVGITELRCSNKTAGTARWERRVEVNLLGAQD